MANWFRRTGKNGDAEDEERREDEVVPAPIRLQLESGDKTNGSEGSESEPDATASASMQPSGIWLVCRFDKNMEEGTHEGPYRNSGPYKVEIIEAEDAIKAMQKVYLKEVEEQRRGGDERERADARFVVFDFYTGDRTEALFEGEWRANIQLAGMPKPNQTDDQGG